MLWAFAVIAVVLVTITVQLLVVYQKRANELRLRQEPIRRRIREHVRGMQDATVRIRSTATQHLEALDSEVGYLRKQSAQLAVLLKRAQERLVGQAIREVASVEEAATNSPLAEEEPGETEDASREVLREANHKRDEIDGHISSLRRDLEIVRSTVQRIETRLARRGGRVPEERSR